MNKIKIFKASHFYPRVLELLYQNNPDLLDKTYSEQYKETMSTFFSWVDIWKINLEQTGEFEVEEIITNNEPMQKKWAEENKTKYGDSTWLLDILESQILLFKPDVFFAHDYLNITSDFLRKIKKKCPSIKLIIGWDGIAMNDLSRFEEFDLMLSCLPSVCDFYSANGLKSYYMHFPFDTRILNKLKDNKPKYDFSFVGSLMKGGIHETRINTVLELLTKTSLKIWSPHQPEHGIIYKLPQRQRLLKGKYKEFWQTYKLGKRWQGTVFGLDMYQVLADSKITFNIHVDVAGDYAANMRLWEATGVGTCLLTDYKSNLANLFEPDLEVVTYKSIPESIDKLKFLLNNDTERDKIAKAGMNRTLKNYSAKVVLEKFGEYLKKIL